MFETTAAAFLSSAPAASLLRLTWVARQAFGILSLPVAIAVDVAAAACAPTWPGVLRWRVAASRVVTAIALAGWLVFAANKAHVGKWPSYLRDDSMMLIEINIVLYDNFHSVLWCWVQSAAMMMRATIVGFKIVFSTVAGQSLPVLIGMVVGYGLLCPS